jgi:hypothetical protein
MTRETRATLEAAADREGRSVSEVAEMWLTQAARGQAEYRAKIGGSQIGEAIEALLDYARNVEDHVGDPRTFLPARDALIAGWRTLLDKALPYTPDTPEGERFRIARANLRALCQSVVLRVVDRAKQDSAAFDYLTQVPATANALNAFARSQHQDGALAQRLLDVSAHSRREDLNALVTALTSAGAPPPSLVNDIAEISAAISAYKEAYRAYMEPRWAAVDAGIALAESRGNIPPADTEREQNY